MIFIALLATLSTLTAQDEIVATANESKKPDLVATNFEVRCGRNQLSLKGVSGGGSRFDAPSVEFNRRRVNLQSDVTAFLLAERATYRVSAGCSTRGGGIQILVFRAQGTIDGSVSYAVKALQIAADGSITDREIETSAAEAFWFR